jgi:hypothetical protein
MRASMAARIMRAAIMTERMEVSMEVPAGDPPGCTIERESAHAADDAV